MFCCLSFPVVASPAVTLTFPPGGQLNLLISNSNPNLITIPGDRIISISSASGMLADKKNTKSGAVFFSSLTDKPFTFFVETELGQVLSVNATPRKGEGRTYRLFAEKSSPRPVAKAWETGQPYESMLVSLNSSLMRGILPDGYGPAPLDKEPNINASGLMATPKSAWTGNSLHVVRYQLVNPLSIPVPLREQDFWKPGTRAVMVHPKYNRLIPGASTFLYVTRTEEASDE
ncbi:conjugal transfer protein TraK (plasmid) [Aeromonas salmonicida]|nr:conjugal transfer protein TraK [Aeromonas salmonicida]